MARLTFVIVSLFLATQIRAADSPIAKFTETGQLAKGVKELAKAVKANPKDANSCKRLINVTSLNGHSRPKTTSACPSGSAGSSRCPLYETCPASYSLLEPGVSPLLRSEIGLTL